MFCPKCGSDESNNTTMYCSKCGFNLEKLKGDPTYVNPTTNNAPVQQAPVKSAIGSMITMLATIIFIICVVGSIMMMYSENMVYGVATILGSALVYFLCLGISNVCHLLKSIDSKLK